uniref:Uncharacterized protein n=1 Tax=Timema poppense TaxID=170557 RepID=A0A7R9DEW1_TIMPO|nr:unnamed protein product [Timema poppensis]
MASLVLTDSSQLTYDSQHLVNSIEYVGLLVGITQRFCVNDVAYSEISKSEIGSGGEDDDKQAVIPVPEPKTPSVQPSIVYQVN